MPKRFLGKKAEKEIGLCLVALKCHPFVHRFIYITRNHSASWQTHKPTVQFIGIGEVKTEKI